MTEHTSANTVVHQSFIKTSMLNKKISNEPIADLHFSGLHWIEASAGTGKTYTLSSLMVRIFLEKYLPRQVIATTFTRKAAAELKSRIRARLQETYRYFDACRDLSEQEILLKAQQEKDPLFAKLLLTFATQVAYACERLKLVIDQLDELFVGTLDSFSQKLLREFAFESGKIERAEITDDAKSYSHQLIHDVLREWIQAQPQEVVDYLVVNKKLKSQDGYIDLVDKTLNFSNAKILQSQDVNIDFNQLKQAVADLVAVDLSTISKLSPYYELESISADKFLKPWSEPGVMKSLLFNDLPLLIEKLKENGYAVLFDEKYSQTLSLLEKLTQKTLSTAKTKKIPQQVYDDFNFHPVIRAFTIFFEIYHAFKGALTKVEEQLNIHLVQEVKKRLPQVLQQKGETTFAQQIRTLAEALQGEQGQRFATFVHARYPLILVDEFQDTNQDQDDMLAQIWRHPSRVKQGCMIMVGDRKQAIYGFRGGDMLTFLKAHQDVFGKDGHEYNLIYNHRSVKPLVETVDALFQRQMDFGEQVIYPPVQAGSRPHPALMQGESENLQPLRWLQLEKPEQEAEQVAWKIRDLLNQSIQGTLYFQEKGQQRPLDESDIAILAPSKSDLDAAQNALQFYGILCNRESKQSVFDSQIARDVGAVLTAIMHPYDEAKVKRALLSRLLGFQLSDLIKLEQHADGLSQYIEQFDLIREMWLNQGFLTAWQYTLHQFSVWTKLVATRSRDNERVVVNLRHLTELLSQHSEEYQGAQNLYHWYLKQLTSPMEREWELERKLSNAAGIRLMTIHASKGLEFNVVFLLGADKALNSDNSLIFTHTEQLNHDNHQIEKHRVISLNTEDKDDKSLAKQHHKERALAEHHRLWYVALTRASHRVYAVMRNDLDQYDKKGKLKTKSTTGLAFWRGHPAAAFEHCGSVVEPLLTECPPRLKKIETEIQPVIVAQALPSQRFYPRGKTSFSALAQHSVRQKAQDHLAVFEHGQDRAADEVQSEKANFGWQNNPANPSQPVQPIAWIKANFPKGTVAGNFLHEIFEHIDFQNRQFWHLEIHRRFKNDYAGLWAELIEKYQQAFPSEALQQQHEDTLIQWVMAWLQDVLNTPLLDHFCLGQLQAHEHLAEFPFYLALSDRVLAIQRIYDLFDEYKDTQKIQMPEFNRANSARYLNGSIDLVFFDGQRYHIADYKSNFLGTDQQHYNADAIQNSMSSASYWLQAALYLVALHRYLSIKLEHYQIDQHLGGASYLYLRGMNGEVGQGYYYWRPDSEFILRLDAILGYFAEDKLGNIA